MGFEVYVAPPRAGRGRRPGAPTIRLSRKGRRISLSKAATELLPKSCVKVLVAFDPAERKIAIISTFEIDPKGRAISGGKTNSRSVSIAEFAEEHEIPDGTYTVAAAQIPVSGLSDLRTGIVTEAVPTYTPEETP